MKYLIRNTKIVMATRIVQGSLCLEDGVISCIGEPVGGRSGYTVIDGRGQYAVPGFIDIHCHGGIGFDLTAGRYDPKKKRFDASIGHYQESLGALMRHFARQGVTRVLLSTLAAPTKRLEGVLREVAGYMRDGGNGTKSAELAGAFIEGTFIKNPDYAGAQNAAYFQRPSIRLFERLNRAAGGGIRYVNVAPEHGEAARRLVSHLTERGVLVGAGHTRCSADTYMRAVDKGLRVAVHFTNGPTGSSFKPFGGGGVLQSVLTSRRVSAELIADGYHVNPAYLRDILQRKRPARIVSVTDAMFMTGVRGVSSFEVYGIKGRLSGNRKYLQVEGKENTLFGSVLTMPVAFANWVSYLTREMRGIWFAEHVPYETDDAVHIASRLCAGNPAALLGVLEPASRYLGQDLSEYGGTLSLGKRADVVLLKLKGKPGNYRAGISAVFIKGRRVR